MSAYLLCRLSSTPGSFKYVNLVISSTPPWSASSSLGYNFSGKSNTYQKFQIPPPDKTNKPKNQKLNSITYLKTNKTQKNIYHFTFLPCWVRTWTCLPIKSLTSPATQADSLSSTQTFEPFRKAIFFKFFFLLLNHRSISFEEDEKTNSQKNKIKRWNCLKFELTKP